MGVLSNMIPADRQRAVSGILTVLDLVPHGKLDALITAIGNDTASVSSIGTVAGIGESAADSVTFLLENKEIQRDAILLALDTARAVASRSHAECETVEMTWTGPVQFSGGDRSHTSVLAGMIAGASQTVAVVGYSITSGADAVIRQLVEAAERGVAITIVVHNDEECANLDILRRSWGGHSRPRLFTRDPKADDGYYKIHAKMVVVDSSDMLVTSANLTWHGMNRNFEIGLRIRGQTARKGQALVNDLIARGYLEEISW